VTRDHLYGSGEKLKGELDGAVAADLIQGVEGTALSASAELPASICVHSLPLERKSSSQNSLKFNATDRQSWRSK